MLLVFSVDGKVRIAMINGQGNFHDSTLSDDGVHQIMNQLYQLYGAYIVVDNAFKPEDGLYLI